MARIRRANTKPELIVRRLLHALGYRFRVQLAGVPGRPDVAFPKRRKAIFIHGCFWHAHEGCPIHRVPRTRPEFWIAKFERNRERDRRLLAAAVASGWECLVIWECELKEHKPIAERLRSFLGDARLLVTAGHSSAFSSAPSFPPAIV